MNAKIERADNGIVEFLQGIKERNGLKSDSALARYLGISQAGIGKIMLGTVPKNETLQKIAVVTKTDYLYLVALADKSRPALQGVTKQIDQAIKKMAPLAAAAFFFFAPFQGLPEAQAMLQADNGSIYYQTLIVILAFWLTRKPLERLLTLARPLTRRFLPIVAFLPLLVACGQNSTAADRMPPGITHSEKLSAYLEREFQRAKECSELPAGDFADLSISIEPPIFDCDDGMSARSCNGEFFPPNTIKIGVAYVFDHEVIHYLLSINTGDPDPDHRSTLFLKCA